MPSVIPIGIPGEVLGGNPGRISGTIPGGIPDRNPGKIPCAFIFLGEFWLALLEKKKTWWNS